MYVMCMFYLYSCHVVRDHGYRFYLCTCLYVFYLYPYHLIHGAWVLGSVSDCLYVCYVYVLFVFMPCGA